MCATVRLLCVVLLCATLAARPAAAQPYTLHLLEDLPGGVESGRALALNESGAIVGIGYAASGARPCLWLPGVAPLDLGVVAQQTFGAALAINGQNVVVGRCDNGGLPHRAVRWTSLEGLTDMGLPPSYSGAHATSVNDNGWIVGTATFATSSDAWLWRPGLGFTVIGDLPGGMVEGQALAINAAGVVAGSVAIDVGWRGATWTLAGGWVQLADFPGTVSSQARAINAAGVTAGYAALASGHRRALRWSADGASVQNLGLPPGYSGADASGINDHGQIVGTLISGAPLRAFIWDAEHGLRDLNILTGGLQGWTLREAADINNAGQIVGTAVNGPLTRAFLLTPPAPPPPACPADLNGDGFVDQADLAALLANYGSTDALPSDGDVDGDGDVDQGDLAGLLGVYGQACP